VWEKWRRRRRRIDGGATTFSDGKNVPGAGSPGAAKASRYVLPRKARQISFHFNSEKERIRGDEKRPKT
jgi:hypothetical protein